MTSASVRYCVVLRRALIAAGGKGMKKKENHLRGYIGEMTVELAKMAREDGLDLVAHLLEMAALETQSANKETHVVQCR